MISLHIRLSDLHLHCRSGAASEPAQIGNAFNAPHRTAQRSVSGKTGYSAKWSTLLLGSTSLPLEWMRRRDDERRRRSQWTGLQQQQWLRHVAHCGPRKAAAAAAAAADIVSGRNLWPSSLVVARMRNCDITKAA